MKSLLRTFHHDMHTSHITRYSIPPEMWQPLGNYLSFDLVFTAKPPGTSIPLESRLVSVLTGASGCVFLIMQVPSERSLKNHVGFLRFLSIGSPRTMKLETFADARASGTTSSVGGYVKQPVLGQIWFSETFHRTEFLRLGIPVQRQMQRDIASYEALAQVGLIIAMIHLCPCSRVPIRLCSGSDNTGAEAGINNMFTTSRPLAFFLERIALLSAMRRIILDVHHIHGELHEKRDALSRPQERAHPPDCLPNEQLRVSLTDIWQPIARIRMAPPGSRLSWQIRASGVPDQTSHDIWASGA